MSATLSADRQQLSRFFDALFRYATPGSFVSLRGFSHRDDMPMFYPRMRPPFPCVQVGDANLIERVADVATWMARQPEGVVFCPPVATFTNDQHAREEDIANGLSISVDCDQKPAEARAKIESLLGRPTIAVASGGEWHDPIAKTTEPKIHLHWRLAEPTREPNGHKRLKRARELAAKYITADASSKPVVHPLRWPGSWHTKKPDAKEWCLAKIITETSNEIELGDALDLLSCAVEVDFGDDAGKGMDGIEAHAAKTDEHWQRLALGVNKGTIGRPDALTSVFGYMLRLGMEPHLAVSLAQAYNRIFLHPPLDDDKVDRTLESIIKREMRR